MDNRSLDVGVLVQRGLGLSSDNTALWRKNLCEGENNKSLSLFDAIMPDLVVSLTSYPHRFMQPDFLSVLKSLRNQKTNINYQIVLSLFKDDISKIPLETREYIQNNGIQILACDEDIKSHKKYFYVMQRYAFIPVITVDDDVVYRNNLVEDMYGTYLENKGYVVCGRCCKMLRDGTGKILPTEKWNTWQNTHEIPSGCKDEDLFGIGCGGILYPPEFCKEIKPYLRNVMSVVEPDDFLLYMLSRKCGLKVMVANTENRYKKSSLGLFGDYSNDCARDKFALWQRNKETKVDDKNVGFLNKYGNLDELVKKPH